ncbi:phenazine antibiotic biosynthesis protein [Amycolatopsis sp. NBC_00355]|uniref:phenazine antibiotic biosynthesis protein n=1 Tax=Amycolatopsis sp. NBC_00355 TaxID=2975957 RepID=UPI002E265391
MSLAVDVTEILDHPADQAPAADEFVRAAMQWHFGPETGSPYWLEKAKTLEFDPRKDVHGVADLTLFPNTVNELRDVPVRDLVPRGYGADARPFGVYESGGTTGAPKRVVCMADWMDRWVAFWTEQMAARGCPADTNILAVMPTGPHIYGTVMQHWAQRNRGTLFTVDMDPRWVKKCIAQGRADEAGRYAEHLIGQAEFILRTQEVGVLVATPPLLERISRNDELVDIINEKVQFIQWGGAHMDADTRHLFRTEIFPGAKLQGSYGSTMILCGTVERQGLGEDDCVFDTFAPFVSFSVIDPATGKPVEYGERGQVVMNHVSKGMLLPNNLERDMATRLEAPEGHPGDSVAAIGPVETFEDETVIEGVY